MMCHRHDMFPVAEFGLENEHLRSLTSLRCVRNNMAATMIHSWETPNTTPASPAAEVSGIVSSPRWQRLEADSWTTQDRCRDISGRGIYQPHVETKAQCRLIGRDSPCSWCWQYSSGVLARTPRRCVCRGSKDRLWIPVPSHLQMPRWFGMVRTSTTETVICGQVSGPTERWCSDPAGQVLSMPTDRCR